MIFDTQKRQHVAKCPRCGRPHHYTEVKFPAENDRGSWLAECAGCGGTFTIALLNPDESYTGGDWIRARFDNHIDPYTGDAPAAGAVARYQLDLKEDRPRFIYDRNPIYRCGVCDADLEVQALAAVQPHEADIGDRHHQAVQNFLSRRMPEVEHAVVTIPMSCTCGEPRTATFYYAFRTNGSPAPPAADMLLADVSGADLSDTLSGVVTKTAAMDALDKLIVRWRLFADQVLIAAPFVAHQYKTKAERLAIWERLLVQLDARRTLFLTKAASYAEYKAALKESGLDPDVLADFGLENQIVAAGSKKQNFHAKVYVGLGPRCEVLSGSANLVEGPSLENVSFAQMVRDRVQRRYLDPLGVTPPAAPPRAAHHVRFPLLVEGAPWSIESGAAPDRA